VSFFQEIKYNIGTRLGRPRRENLLRHVPKNATCAEIGVFKGEFTKYILKITKPKKLHLIDVWWLEYGEYYPDWQSYTDFGQLKTKDAYDQVLKNVARYRGKSEVQVHVEDDLSFLEKSDDNYFDWVYLDSSHEYEHSKNELNLLRHKVKASGLITGDDYIEDPSDLHYGVCKAVNEFCRANHLSLKLLELGQWIIKNEK
jgi:hypothetical protein